MKSYFLYSMNLSTNNGKMVVIVINKINNKIRCVMMPFRLDLRLKYENKWKYMAI